MKKNVVFIPNISTGDGRSNPYRYSIMSWKAWCKKNDCELVIFDTPIAEVSEMRITWQRYYVMDILDNSGIEFDQILMVDADTIVHPDCPNFFELTERKFCAVHNDGNYDWVCRSVENYGKHLFNDVPVPFSPFEYFNTGFMIFNESHREFLNYINKFYIDNSTGIKELQNTYHVGTCQPVVNFLIRRQKVDLKLLPYKFNMQDIVLKEGLTPDLLMTKFGWVYHYNAIPQEFKKQYGDVAFWMEYTYKALYHEGE